MAISFRTPVSVTAASGAGFTMPVPAAVADGDFLVAVVTNAGTSGPAAPTGWTRPYSVSAGSGQCCSIFTATYSAGLTRAFTNAASAAVAVCGAYFEASRTVGLDVTPVATVNTTNNTTLPTGAPTTGTLAGDFEVLAYSHTAAPTIATTATGSTIDLRAVNGTACTAILGHNNTTSLGASTACTAFSHTLSASNTRKTGVGILLRSVVYKALTGAAGGSSAPSGTLSKKVSLAGAALGEATASGTIDKIEPVGGTGEWTFITAHGQGLGSNGGDTSAINTTGADTIFLVVGSATSGAPSVSDSKSNTWDLIHAENSGFDHLCRLYRAKNATVGSGHTFTATLSGGNVGIGVLAFSGGHLTAPDDQHEGAASVFSDNVQPGSITPSEDDTLVMMAVAIVGDGRNVASITESYSVSVNLAETGTNFGIGVAYRLQTTATATNPTWTLSASGLTNTAVSASFKVGAPVGPTPVDLIGSSSGAAIVGPVFKWSDGGTYGAAVWGGSRATQITGGPPAAGPKDITGSTSGSSATTALPTRKRQLVVAAVGVATTTGLPTRTRPLVVASAGSSSTTATPTRRRGLTVAATGVALTTAGASRRRPLMAVSSGLSVAGGTISKTSAFKYVSGAATGQSTTIATPSRKRVLVAAATGIAVAVAAIARRRALVAAAAGGATVAVALSRRRALSAVSVGTATTFASVDKAGSVFRAIFGASVGRATSAGTTTRRRALIVASVGQAVTVATPTRRRSLSAGSVGRATTVATATRRRAITATSVGQATASGAIDKAGGLIRPLVGASSGVATTLSVIDRIEYVVPHLEPVPGWLIILATPADALPGRAIVTPAEPVAGAALITLSSTAAGRVIVVPSAPSAGHAVVAEPTLMPGLAVGARGA